jgi:peptidoglycan/LPS O-acetylase OafA/YrhL
MRLREIERLRAFAILMVMVQHLGKLRATFHPWFREGGPGVDLFFVISGFVVTRSLLGLLPRFSPEQGPLARIDAARPALQTFLLRRVFRILPMAALWCFIPLLLSLTFNEANGYGPPQQILRETFAVLTLCYNYAVAYGIGNRLGYYWSLSSEEQFYLLMPLVLVLAGTAARRMAVLVAGIALSVLVLRPLIAFDGPPEWAWAWRGFVGHRRLDGLLAGALLCLLREQGWLAAWGRMPRLLAAGISAFCLLCIYTIQGIMPSAFFFGAGQLVLAILCSVVVLLASFDRKVVLQVPGLSPLLEWLGARSYGMYLIHSPVWTLHELRYHPGLELPAWYGAAFEQPWAWTAMVVAATVLLSDVCHRLIERPLIAQGQLRTRAAYLSSPSMAVR